MKFESEFEEKRKGYERETSRLTCVVHGHQREVVLQPDNY